MNEIKVSIIIPIYNPGVLLIDCLNSAKNQTLKDIEILCIDDGSNDDSSDILKNYAKKDIRFKIFSQKNQGAGNARNFGINHAKGKYIVFLDSDDWIEKEMCEKLYFHAESLNVDLVLFNTIRHLQNNKTRDLTHFKDDFKKNFKTFTFDYKFIKDKVMNGYFGVIWCKFYKTSFIKENNILFTEHKMFNDVEFHIKTLLLAKTIAYYPKIFYHYIMIGQPSLQNSFTGTYDSICFYDVMIGVRNFLIKHEFMEEFRIEYLNYAFFYFKTKLNQMNKSYKSEYFIKIKNFFENETITIQDIQKINPQYISYYIHLINSHNYDEFNKWEVTFNGELIEKTNFNSTILLNNNNLWDLHYEITPISDTKKNDYTKIYSNILEKNLIIKEKELLEVYAQIKQYDFKIEEYESNMKKCKNLIEDLKKENESLKFSQIKVNAENIYLKNLKRI